MANNNNNNNKYNILLDVISHYGIYHVAILLGISFRIHSDVPKMKFTAREKQHDNIRSLCLSDSNIIVVLLYH